VLIIGENIQILSPAVKAAIESRDAKAIQAQALLQVEAGAGILDLNIGPQKKRGAEIMPWIVEAVQEVTDVPLSLDTTNLAAMEAGLQVCRGRATLNSASADPERLDSVMRLAAKYDAPPQELVALAACAAEYGGLYISHIRNEGQHILDALNELIDVADQARQQRDITF